MRNFQRILLPAALVLGLAGTVPGEERAEGDWWSLQSVARPEVPGVKKADWVKNPIDAFILSKLEEMGLEPAPEASAAVMRRRSLVPPIGVLQDREQCRLWLTEHGDWQQRR